MHEEKENTDHFSFAYNSSNEILPVLLCCKTNGVEGHELLLSLFIFSRVNLIVSIFLLVLITISVISKVVVTQMRLYSILCLSFFFIKP